MICHFSKSYFQIPSHGELGSNMNVERGTARHAIVNIYHIPNPCFLDLKVLECQDKLRLGSIETSLLVERGSEKVTCWGPHLQTGVSRMTLGEFLDLH